MSGQTIVAALLFTSNLVRSFTVINVLFSLFSFTYKKCRFKPLLDGKNLSVSCDCLKLFVLTFTLSPDTKKGNVARSFYLHL